MHIRNCTVNPCYLTHGVKSSQRIFAISKSCKLNLNLSEVENFFDSILPHGVNNKDLRYLKILKRGQTYNNNRNIYKEG